MPSYEPVTALLRGLDVLRAVNRLNTAGVRDIHRLTGLNQPTIVRMLETLIHAGYVIRHPHQPLYMPTGKTLELSGGYALHRQIGVAAIPVMSRLRQAVGWPSDVGVFDGDAMVVAHTSRGEGRFLFERRTGFRAPILATSLGRAYLAFCAEAERERALTLAARSPEPWNALAARPAEVAACLAGIRAAGYATMDDAYASREYGGLASAIAVPVLAGGLAVASLNLMYLRDAIGLEGVVERMMPLLREAASELGGLITGIAQPTG
ncbi:helix-turn-helix domain-containing protein [Roseomonas sp. SSH11]|uniref:Helix-turn-helix domain-containing protein n=1 Tax=Pararoseomonas baculiformis TaxID=2820812 RepID=A0ABS4A9Y5_9PROT|nr:helix-turn-helix domain-containing protein [Pararoseomonas baculiformis]MBP0443797.1 helix-turn-helix domain-containing protein [Pararoseomonas baculiformis]